MNKHNVFILHGVGSQSQGYSKTLIEKIEAQLNHTKAVQFFEIVYSDIMDEQVRSYTLNENVVKGIKLHDLRSMFNLIAFDGISYGYKKTKILNHIKTIVSQHSEGCQNTFIAHSLGGLVLYDFLAKFGFVADNVFTLGSPLALRLIGKKEKINVKFWINIVGSCDIIGKPLKTDFMNIQDCDCDYVAPIGGLLARETPLCHTDYWSDDNVIKPIAKKISLDISGKFDRKSYFKWIDEVWKI